MALLGIFKAVVGLLIRPTVGTLELLGKSAHGVGLLFLGREGISGTIQKRARAPGTLTDDSDEVLACSMPAQCNQGCDVVHHSLIAFGRLIRPLNACCCARVKRYVLKCAWQYS